MIFFEEKKPSDDTSRKEESFSFQETTCFREQPDFYMLWLLVQLHMRNKQRLERRARRGRKNEARKNFKMEKSTFSSARKYSALFSYIQKSSIYIHTLNDMCCCALTQLPFAKVAVLHTLSAKFINQKTHMRKNVHKINHHQWKNTARDIKNGHDASARVTALKSASNHQFLH